ncbi:hypothetical protein SYJ56_16140 [Algoriphagus sp. D3-2-R+10]|uniref:hypothetical protein n=1 Tax=Algoriphagus aurantiacus TaxID=3103948 RepID=UPI002B3D5641|nr:hypothetical protein [Algoriphagus sp. D3-2-R+10]MEB2776858.1 hypothetical protein [Algoriphagus sp. D3-2-R+10]
MKLKSLFFLFVIYVFSVFTAFCQTTRKTTVRISSDKFYINNELTYAGQTWEGNPIEGLLMNSRMVQGIFDDLNPETVKNWEYPDTKEWDADRNTDEFVSHMAEWKSYGLLSFTINLQGGSPFGYSQGQPWINSPYTENGELRSEYFSRLERILDKADELGLVPIIGLFYFGQDENLKDEAAVINAVNNVIDWLHSKAYKNVLIEVNNECNVRYDHQILQPERVHELIELVKSKEKNGYRFPVSTSYGGGTIPKENVVIASDFILLHGNGVSDPEKIVEMVEKTRNVTGYGSKPIVFNEDDHFNFDQPKNNFTAAVSAYASWGYFDYRMKDEGFEEGYQSVPVDWGINSERKKGFFELLKKITGY